MIRSDTYAKVYDQASRNEKTLMAEWIVKQMRSSVGRFLKHNDDIDCWEEVDDLEARKKVAHAFRNRRKPTTATN